MTNSQKNTELPLVFLDIDGTLLDSDYKSNDATLPEYINHLQESKDFIFALNSNRSLEDILPIAKKFAITGPLIGENGIFSYSLATDKITYFLNELERKKLVVSKKKVEFLIKNALTEFFENNRVVWRDTDTVKLISEETHSEDYKEGDIVVLNNSFRRYTISAHLFTFSEGELRTVEGVHVKAILERIKDTCSALGLVIEYDGNFSNILVYSTKVSKFSAVKGVIDAYGNRKLYSIGDTISDFNMTEDIGTFMAVRNASAEARARAKCVSRQTSALGVRELLGVIE